MEKKYILTLIILVSFFTNLEAQTCSAPNKNPEVQIAYITDTALDVIITEASPAPDGYLVVRRTSADNNSSLWPSTTTYVVGDVALGGEIVSFGNSLTFSDSGLTELTTYYYYFYPYNICNDGTKSYTNDVPGYPSQTKNDACYSEDFEGVTFNNGNASKFCGYDEAPEEWIISKKACIEDTGGHGNADSNHASMYGSSDYIISPLILNPTIVEFWAKAANAPNNIARITVQYSTTGVGNWQDLPFYAANGDTSNGDITNDWERYIIDFTLLNASTGLIEGDYYIKWIFNGNPFDFSIDDIKLYCSGSTINCPPQATWTKADPNDESTLNWWETDEDGNLVTPYNANSPTVDISTTIKEDYDTSTYGDFETCSLTIDSGATLNINSDENDASKHHYVTIIKQLKVDGTLLVQDKNSLIMVNNNGEVINNGVTHIIKRATPTKNYDYTYWSSPVEDASFSSFVGSYQGYIFKYVTENFKDLYDNSTGNGTSGEADGLDDDEPYLDPGTWQQWNPNYDWQKPTETTMIPGEGYTVIAPSGGSLAGQEVTFSGAVNNGKIKHDIYLSSNVQSQDTLVYPYDYDDWNLIGNPYPSAIDAAAFLGNPSNISLIGGTAYLWTHTNEISRSNVGYGGYKNFAKGDYAYFNRAGEVLTFPNQGRDLLGKIASGQSFMVEANATGTSGSKVGSVIFINSMRYGERESDSKVYPSHNNTEFYKPTNSKNKKVENSIVQPNKIWLNLTENVGAFSQMLVGFFEHNYSNIEHATDGVDRAYDGKRLISGNYVDIYSIIDDKPFAIQGRTSLNNNDVIPIGFNSNITGTLKISIDRLEGELANREIYLEDKLLHNEGEYHLLSESDYEFTLAKPGTFDKRFNLRFSKSAVLNVDDEEYTNKDIVVVNYDDEIVFKSLKANNIKQIIAFDLLGRIITSKIVNKENYTLSSPNFSAGTVLIFKVLLNNGQIVSKKFIKL